MDHAREVKSDRFWIWFLPALCVLATIAQISAVINTLWPPGGRPWYGYWDAVVYATEQPYVGGFSNITTGGASDRAGIRENDRVDLRDIAPYERVAFFFQPVTWRDLNLVIARDGKKIPVRVVPTSVYQADSAYKIWNDLVGNVAQFWALACAWLLALRRSNAREGRYLGLTLLALVFGTISPTSIALPNATLSAMQILVTTVAGCGTLVLPVLLATRFGERSLLRTLAETATIVLALVGLAGGAALAIGILTLWFDPLPYSFAPLWRFGVYMGAIAGTTLTVLLAATTTKRAERARAAWLLLPLPIAGILAEAAATLQAFASSWGQYMAFGILASSMILLGAAAVTYALLRRRVLDFQFVVSRTLVVAGVSAVIVVSFVLLEWLLGNVLANVSHATGLVANAALALVLGLSMGFIHKRVDGFVDFVFFHKRHADEHALRDFAKEAPFVTKRDDLLDHTIEKVRTHTDAEAAAVLLDGDGTYRPARWFGDLPIDTGENDAAVLALKAWHKPVDPHHYATTLAGDLALPMLARGRLVGVLLCGRREGGEAYSPDEVDALHEFARGVGVALDSIDRTESTPERDAAILDELRALREQVARLNVRAE